jgi:thioredoxin 1
MLGLNPITDKNFEAEVLQASGPVMVYFTSPWCGPCKMLEPVLEQVIAGEWAESMRFAEVNILNDVGMAIRHSVLKAPTLMLFKDGKPVERITGYHPKAKLMATFAPHLS